jgi:hypothetical protein
MNCQIHEGDVMSKHSRLFYNNSHTEVCLGDIVKVKVGFIFSKFKEGKVIYLPHISPYDSEMEIEGLHYWAIKMQDNTVLAMPYLPDTHQPKSTIYFIKQSELTESEVKDKFI